MRIRTVKPEWLDDDALVEAGSDARVLSIALILLADDAGRGRIGLATPAKVFPCDPSAFHEALMRLSPWYVRVYEVRGQKYFQIQNWKKHQKIQHPGKPHTPDPSEGRYVDGHPDPEPEKNPPPIGRGESHEDSGGSHEPLTPDLDQDQYLDPDHARGRGGEPPLSEHIEPRPGGNFGIRRPHGYAQFMAVFSDAFARKVTTSTLEMFSDRDRQSGRDILAFCTQRHPEDPDGFYLAEVAGFCELVLGNRVVVKRNAYAAFAGHFGTWQTRLAEAEEAA